MTDQSDWNAGQGGFQPPRPGQPPHQYEPPQQYQQPQYQPPQQSGPYGQPYGAPVIPQKRRKWPWIVGGIFLLFLLGIGGCSYLVFSLAKGPVDGANEWVAMLDNGDFVGAQASMCGGANNATDPATLAADFGVGSGIDDFNLSSVQSTNGATTVEGTVTTNGAVRSLTLSMSNVSDAWRVCDYLLL